MAIGIGALIGMLATKQTVGIFGIAAGAEATGSQISATISRVGEQVGEEAAAAQLPRGPITPGAKPGLPIQTGTGEAEESYRARGTQQDILQELKRQGKKGVPEAKKIITKPIGSYF